MNEIFGAIDWLSVKFTTITIPFLFIGNGLMQGLGITVMLSTLAYNLIRIYKEIKRKKDAEN